MPSTCDEELSSSWALPGGRTRAVAAVLRCSRLRNRGRSAGHWASGNRTVIRQPVHGPLTLPAGADCRERNARHQASRCGGQSPSLGLPIRRRRTTAGGRRPHLRSSASVSAGAPLPAAVLRPASYLCCQEQLPAGGRDGLGCGIEQRSRGKQVGVARLAERGEERRMRAVACSQPLPSWRLASAPGQLPAGRQAPAGGRLVRSFAATAPGSVPLIARRWMLVTVADPRWAVLGNRYSSASLQQGAGTELLAV